MGGGGIFYLYKVLISVFKPFARLASNFDWGTRENRGNVLSLVLKLKAEWVDFYWKKSRQTRVPKLVYICIVG